MWAFAKLELEGGEVGAASQEEAEVHSDTTFPSYFQGPGGISAKLLSGVLLRECNAQDLANASVAFSKLERKEEALMMYGMQDEALMKAVSTGAPTP